MNKLTLLDKKRNHFVNAVFEHLKQKNKKSSFIRNVDGVSYQVDLDKELLRQSLISLFEKNICITNLKMNELQIIGVYENFYSKYGNISNEGKDFISVITGLIASHLHEKETKKCAASLN
ncbi:MULTISPECIES: hypothetical protein [Providencia]|uniref:hypothetical protein n=1 Tax=Providencia TaxID=586 RepID=UPI001C82BD21|nr:hypothetical protein [Providencia rettgeri]MBX6968232.1 hypothetical protein [Providencia rettgeri]MBX6978023.1 hypothetical protein [Providencia rettgeri]MBX6994962.1 hypothetical protein [Providencia rettgeri]MBX6996097.1 hypothetical protein [Providencia rettgeri]MBX7017333.1 hypothetical protein [Providencia rettgeri]